MKVALIAAYNEELTISQAIADTLPHVDRVIVCDDGSSDGTTDTVMKYAAWKSGEPAAYHVIALRHERNEGKGQALRSLFLKAIEMNADEIITIDADLQHDAKEIPKLLEALKDADVVIGSRTGLGTVRALGNRILSGKEFDTQSGFRAYRGSVLPFLIPSEQGYGADAEILGTATAKGLRIAQVPVSNIDAVPNPHKANIAYHFLDVLFTDFKMLTFRHPLLVYGLPGLVFLGFAAYFAYGDFSYLVTQGFGSVMLALVGLFLLSTALIIWTVSSLTRRAQT